MEAGKALPVPRQYKGVAVKHASKTKTTLVGGKISLGRRKERRIGVRSFKLTTILVALTVTALFSMGGIASAYNSHQAHEGACARSTSSISQGVEDLQYNGVLGAFANKVGYKGGNGYYKYQMEHGLFMARVRKATTTNNERCTGTGGHEYWDKRELVPGEEFAGRVPGKYNREELCKNRSNSCNEEVHWTVSDGFPASCWNNNEGKIELYAFRRHKMHKKQSTAVKIYKIAEDASSHTIPMPTGIFKFEVTAKGYPRKVVTMNHDPETVPTRYKAGTVVYIHELTPSGKDKWILVNPDQHQKVGSHGTTFTVKNKEQASPPPASEPPPSSSPPPSKEGNCNMTINGNNNSGNSIICCANIESPSARQSCECVGYHIHCEEKETPKEPPKEPEQPKVKLEKIQEVEANETRTICAKVDPPSGDVATTQFEVEYGTFTNGGKGIPETGTDRVCAPYKAPSEPPPHVCTEPIAPELPPGTKCDIVSVVVSSSNGSKPVTLTKEIPIIQETSF